MDFTDCVLEGVEIRVKPKPGRGLYVEAAPEAAAAVISAVRASYETVTQADATAKTRGAAGAGQGSDVDSGRIRWHFARNTWVVTFDSTGDGDMQSTTNGLRVSTHDAGGAALTASEYEASRDEMHRKARHVWNVMDKSTAARFAEP